MTSTIKRLSFGVLLTLLPLTLATDAQCPGIQVNDIRNSQYCCVGGTLSMDLGFTIGDITATTTTTDAPLTATSYACSTTIPLDASNYAELVSSASASLAGLEQTNTASPTSTPTAAATQASGGAANTLSAASAELLMTVILGMAVALGI